MISSKDAKAQKTSAILLLQKLDPSFSFLTRYPASPEAGSFLHYCTKSFTSYQQGFDQKKSNKWVGYLTKRN